MKNIQKLAEEIFKAPSDEELLKRTIENSRLIKFPKVPSSLNPHALSHLFPNGAYSIGYYATRNFSKFHEYFKTNIKHWTKFETGFDDGHTHEVAKLNGKTVLRIRDNADNSVFNYKIEAGLF